MKNNRTLIMCFIGNIEGKLSSNQKKIRLFHGLILPTESKTSATA